MEDAQDLMRAAIAAEGRGHRALLAGEPAAEALAEAAALYRASWEAAAPTAYGRLVGMLKADVIGGDAGAAASYAREELAGGADSPVASYALAIAALVEGDDEAAATAADGMRAGPPAMGRAADAIAALAARDTDAYSAAVRAIVADFEARDEHLTGVAIADTALMLEWLARARGMTSGVTSPLLPSNDG